MSEKLIIETNNKFFKIAAIVFFILAASIPSIYFYQQYKNILEKLKDPTVASREEMRSLVERVSQIAELPQGEDPAVATVSDLEKIKNQPFFAHAKLGDKVLVYNNAKKAILYDPTAHKIIEIGPIIISAPAVSTPSSGLLPSPAPAVSPDQKLKLVLFNGTNIVGLTKKFDDIIKSKIPNVEIVDRDNAGKNDYAKTFVVDLSGKNKDTAAKLAALLKGEVSSLPSGEIAPKGAEILIILGSDQTN